MNNWITQGSRVRSLMMRAGVWLWCLGLLWSAYATAASGRLAYVRLDGKVVTVNADGSDERLLGDGLTSYQFPAWSPDGRQVALVGVSPGGGVIHVIDDAPKPSVQTLYRSLDEAPFYLYWSPDGAAVSFLARHPTGIGLHVAEINPSTGAVLGRMTDTDVGLDSLVAEGQPFYWQWFNDSARAFIHSGEWQDADLMVMSLRGGSQVGAGDQVALAGHFRAPGVSSSGDLIAFSGRDGLAGQLVVTNTWPGHTTSAELLEEQVQLELPHEGLIALAWSPVADVLAFTHPGGAVNNTFGPLKVLDATTGFLEELVSEIVVAFFWSPDGKKIAYLTLVSSTDRLVNIPNEATGIYLDGDTKEMVYAVQEMQTVRPSPLMLKLAVADLATGEIKDLLQFRPTRLYVTQFLPFFEQYARSHQVWSQDSQALALPLRSEQGAPVVVVVPLEGAPHVLGVGQSPFWQP